MHRWHPTFGRVSVTLIYYLLLCVSHFEEWEIWWLQNQQKVLKPGGSVSQDQVHLNLQKLMVNFNFCLEWLILFLGTLISDSLIFLASYYFWDGKPARSIRLSLLTNLASFPPQSMQRGIWWLGISIHVFGNQPKTTQNQWPGGFLWWEAWLHSAKRWSLSEVAVQLPEIGQAVNLMRNLGPFFFSSQGIIL